MRLHSFYKLLNENIEFKEEMRGYHNGQSDLTLSIHHNGEPVGYIDYSVYQDVPHIQMVMVAKEQRGKGYGKALIRKLQSMFPDQEIQWGTMTDAGAKLYDKLPKKKVINKDLQDKVDRLKQLKAKEAEFTKIANSGDRDAINSIIDQWNDLNDEIYALEQELEDKQVSKTIIEATRPFEHKKIDPALMTFNEYYEIANPSHKHHPDSAYDWSLADLNKDYIRKELPDYKLYKRIKINGLVFTIKEQVKDAFDSYKTGKYIKLDTNGEPLRNENGDLIYYTPEELIKKHTGRRYYHNYVILNDEDQVVANNSDEWGALLIVVAREYRGFGLGPIITKLVRGKRPDYNSGGFTPGGSRNLYRTYQQFVREYLESGFYSFLVKSGQMTAARAKEIIASAKLEDRPKSKDKNLNTNDPKDWVVFHNKDGGDFVIYDKKLAQMITDEGYYDFFTEKAMKGLIHMNYSEHEKLFYVYSFGAVNEKLKVLLLKLALSYAMREGIPVENTVRTKSLIDDVHFKTNKDNMIELIGPPIEYDNMVRYEELWRKSFDKYDEFKHHMWEMAYMKYGSQNEHESYKLHESPMIDL